MKQLQYRGDKLEVKPTSEIDELLKSMSPEGLNDFLKDNSRYISDEKKAFYYYFKDVLVTKNIRLKEVYQMADVTESYGSKIVTMEKHTKNRDMILRLCIAGHFKLDEINRALKLYGMSPLYSKNKRDVCIIIAVNNRRYNIFEIDEMLEKQGHKKLILDE